MSPLGRRIRELREQNGITQAELGKRIGATATAISYYETGARSVSSDVLVQLADALETTVGSLFGEPEFAPDEVVARAWNNAPQYVREEARGVALYILTRDRERSEKPIGGGSS